MAAGLGVTSEEWEELRENIDDSFWVLRVIGSSIVPPPAWSEAKPIIQGTLHYQMITTDSHVARTSPCLFSFPQIAPLIISFIPRDYGCLTCDLSLSWVYNLNVV